MKSILIFGLSLVFLNGCATRAYRINGVENSEAQPQSAVVSQSSAITAGEWVVEKPKKKKKGPKDPFALVTCVNGMETRTMSIGPKEGDAGCELHYEKNEKSMSVPAYSSNGVQHCLNARSRMQANLVRAGWKCVQ